MDDTIVLCDKSENANNLLKKHLERVYIQTDNHNGELHTRSDVGYLMV